MKYEVFFNATYVCLSALKRILKVKEHNKQAGKELDTPDKKGQKGKSKLI
jgi:hypothetical protein